MKKLTTLSSLLLVGMIITIASCSKNSSQPSIIQATYRGATHTFTSAQGMYIYQSADYGVAQAIESGTNDTTSVTFQGSNIGSYPIGSSYPNFLTFIIGGTTYSSSNHGSYGTIHITRLDASSSMATGDFSGTLYTTDHHDSLPVTQGLISVKYQF